MFYSEVVGGVVSWKLMQLDATNWLKKSWQEMLIKGCWSRNVSHFKEIKFKEIMFSSKLQEGKITSCAKPAWIIVNIDDISTPLRIRRRIWQERVHSHHVYQVMFCHHNEKQSINVKQHYSWYSQKPLGLANADLIPGTILGRVVYGYS